MTVLSARKVGARIIVRVTDSMKAVGGMDALSAWLDNHLLQRNPG